jgi:hypothetical protein
VGGEFRGFPGFGIGTMTAPPPISSSARGPEAGVPRRGYLWWGLGLLGVVMAFAFSSYVIQLLGTIERQNRRLAFVLDSMRVVSDEGDSPGGELRRARKAFSVMQESRGEPLRLSASPRAPRGSGRIVISSSTGALLLIVSGLPSDEGRQYVLRSRGQAGDDSLGSFTVKDTSVHAYVFDPPGRVHEGFVVTTGDRAAEVLTGTDRGANPRPPPGSASRNPHFP